MESGISSYCFGWWVGNADFPSPDPLDAGRLLQWVAAQKINRLQLADNIPLHLMSAIERTALSKTAAALDIQLEAGARYLTAENLFEYIGICNDMGISLLRFVIDGPGYTPQSITVSNIIRSALPLLEASDLLLAIENHDRWTAAKYGTLMETINHPQVGICLDTANSIGAGEGIETVLSALGPYTLNLHLKDISIRRQSYLQGFIVEGSICGSGLLPVQQIIDRLASFGRCQSVILEQWVPPENTVEETILKEKEWALKSLHYLRNLQIP